VAELHGERCLILYNKTSYRLQVRVRGTGKRNRGGILMSHIVKSIETLLGPSSSLVDKEVFLLCPHCLDAGEIAPFQFSLTDVANAVMSGQRFLHCRGLHIR